MKAVQLTGFNGIDSLKVVELDSPKPQAHELLIKVEAAGINFAELEMAKGKYPARKNVPFVKGFEAAGTVIETGIGAHGVKVGDPITAIVSSGGYAEFAVADAAMAIPIPQGVSFAEATTIPIHGLTAFALLKFAAKPQAGETLLNARGQPAGPAPTPVRSHNRFEPQVRGISELSASHEAKRD